MNDRPPPPGNPPVPFEEILAAHGSAVRERWRDIFDKAVAARTEMSPVQVADMGVRAEHRRGLLAENEAAKRGRRALSLLEAIVELHAKGHPMTIENIVADARRVLDAT